MTFIAHFQPEAWINDYAVPIDGAVEWDCTAFILAPEGSSQELWHTAVGLDFGQEFTDDYDELRADLAAPDFVRQHSGPFTITIRRATDD